MKAIACMTLALLLIGPFAYGKDEKAAAPEPWDGVTVELFPAELDGKWGFINRSGHLVIEPQYEAAWDFTEARARVQSEGLRGFIDGAGKMVIEPKYHVAWAFSEGLAAAMVPKSRFGGNVNKWEWEYIYRDGGMFKAVNGTWAGDWCEGKARYKTHAGSGYALNAYQNTDGRGFMFYREPRDFHEGRAGVLAGRKHGYFNHAMKYVIPGEFDAIGDFSEGLAAVSLEKKWGYIDPFGSFVIQPAYEDARPFSSGLAAVKVEGKYGCIDRTGKVVIEPGFDFIAPFSEGLARVVFGGKHGFINVSGETVIAPAYDGGWEFSRGLARVLTGEREDYIDAKGAAVWDDKRREVCRAVAALADAAACRKYVRDAADPYARGAGLARLAALDKEAALGDLLAAAGDAALAGTAADLLGRLPGDGLTAKIAEAMTAATGASKPALITALGIRADGSALDVVKGQLNDGDAAVKLSAIKAVARIGGKISIPDLIGIVGSGSEAERPAAAGELVRMPWKEATSAIAGALKEGPVDTRVMFIQALAARRLNEHAGAVAEAARDANDDVRAAALRALYYVCGEAQIPALVDLVVEAKSDGERAAAETALLEVTGLDVGKPDELADAIAAKLPDVSPAVRISLLRALGKMGGAKGAQAVENALKDEDASVAAAAVEVLAGWPDPEAAGVLLRVATESDDEKTKDTARAGFLRVVRLRSRRSHEQTLELAAGGMEIVTNSDEMRTLLEMLGWMRDISTVKLLEKHLDREGMEQDIARTLAGVAGHTMKANPEETKAALQKIVDGGKVTDKRLLKQIEDLLKK